MTLTATGSRWIEADALFHQDPRWLGSDAAYSIDLGDERSLWLFGDTFVATSPAMVRNMSTFVRNTIGVMTGRDPLTATMDFAWRETGGASTPTAFFSSAGDHWVWPGHGALLPDDSVLVFLNELRPTPGEELGFAVDGWRAVRIGSTAGVPEAWALTDAAVPPLVADHYVACTAIDGDNLVAVVDRGGGGGHVGVLARWPLAATMTADLAAPAWWSGAAWDATDAAGAAVVFEAGATECSLARQDDAWLYVASRGFGRTTIALRAATSITGPYTDPHDAFTPPEGDVENTFVYAAKAHPQLATGASTVVVTYADNSFVFADLFDPAQRDTLYWPHFSRLDVAIGPAD